MDNFKLLSQLDGWKKALCKSDNLDQEKLLHLLSWVSHENSIRDHLCLKSLVSNKSAMTLLNNDLLDEFKGIFSTAFDWNIYTDFNPQRHEYLQWIIEWISGQEALDPTVIEIFCKYLYDWISSESGKEADDFFTSLATVLSNIENSKMHVISDLYFKEYKNKKITIKAMNDSIEKLFRDTANEEGFWIVS